MTLPLIELPHTDGEWQLIALNCTGLDHTESGYFLALAVHSPAIAHDDDLTHRPRLSNRPFTSGTYKRVESYPLVLVPFRFFPEDSFRTIYLNIQGSELHTECLAVHLAGRRKLPGAREASSPCEISVESIYPPNIEAMWGTDDTACESLLLRNVHFYQAIALELSIWPLNQAQNLLSPPRYYYLLLRFEVYWEHGWSEDEHDPEWGVALISVTLMDRPSNSLSLVSWVMWKAAEKSKDDAIDYAHLKSDSEVGFGHEDFSLQGKALSCHATVDGVAAWLNFEVVPSSSMVTRYGVSTGHFRAHEPRSPGLLQVNANSACQPKARMPAGQR